jgi:tripartite-type tricarboxylate transporter receptor subunit TctC
MAARLGSLFGKVDHRTMLRLAGALLGTLGLWRSASALADPIADFYRGKQITLIVGSVPGGGYDLLAREVARRLGEFMPGHPTVIVQNMPGAGSVLMSNHIYNTAPQDGTVIGLVQRGVLLSELLKQPGVRYHIAKFQWLGSVSSEVSLVIAASTSPVSNFRDLQTRGMLVGGTGASSDSEEGARILNALAGTKLKIVSGYPGTADVLLAMQRGEVEGDVDLSWSEMKVKNAGLLAAHKLKLIAQDTLDPSPELPDVPLSMSFITDPVSQKIARLFFAIKKVARPIMAGPGVPADRIAALRKAFDDMTVSAQFKQDAQQQKLDLAPLSHRAIDDFVASANAASPEMIARLTTILSPDQSK